MAFFKRREPCHYGGSPFASEVRAGYNLSHETEEVRF